MSLLALCSQLPLEFFPPVVRNQVSHPSTYIITKTTKDGCCLVAKGVLGITDDSIRLKLKQTLLDTDQGLSSPLDEFN